MLVARNRRPFLAALAAVVVIVCVFGVPPPTGAEEDPRIRAYEQRLDRMQREMDELRARLRAVEQERAAPAAAAPAAAAAGEQDRKIDVLAREVESLKSRIVLPETKELKSYYGLGPAASKVYQVERGLSIGGYGEFDFQKFVNDQRGRRDRFDVARFVLYTGYKFTDRIILNSELEFEHAVVAGDKEGEAEVEFVDLDFLAWRALNFRAGLLLVPMGFINEIHEPPFFYGVFRPEVEQRIIPTTWREGGVGIFGTLAPGLDYRAYVLNGLDAKGFASEGIREGRQEGSLALADDLAGTVRLDYTLLPGALVGGAFWAGDSGQDEAFAGRKPGVFTLIWETHAQVRYRGLELRALGAFIHLDDADLVSEELGETIGEDQYGFYVEAAYDVVPLLFPESTQSFAPFFRYENLDTQDAVPRGFARVPGNAVQLYTVGASYKPHPQVVLKLEYRSFDSGAKAPTPDELNLGAGFVF
jgi:hypothetical protein